MDGWMDGQTDRHNAISILCCWSWLHSKELINCMRAFSLALTSCSWVGINYKLVGQSERQKNGWAYTAKSASRELHVKGDFT